MIRASLVPLLLATPAAAQIGPADVVAEFYTGSLSEFDPQMRDRFAEEGLAALEANDAADGTCIGFSFVIDGQDYNATELEESLSLSEDVYEDNASVTASFLLFGEPRDVVWRLVAVDGEWKVVDVEGDGWRLSELCTEG